MFRAALCSAFCLAVLPLHAQPAIVWQRSIGGSSSDQAYGIAPLPDGGFAVAGFSRSNDGDFADHHGPVGTYDCAAIRLDSLDNIVWKHSLGGSENDLCPCVVRAHDGGLVFAGSEASTDFGFTNHRGAAGTSDGWIIKLNAAGNTVWSKTYGGTLNDGFSRIIATRDGGYLAAGSSNSNDSDVHDHHTPTTTSDLWVVKVDSLGTLQWERSFGGSGFDEAFGLTATDDNAFVAFGGTASNDGDVHLLHGTEDFWLVKFDSAGTIIWERTFGSPHGEDMNSVTLTPDGGYIAGGSAYYDGGEITTPHHGHNDSYDIWIIKVSRDGDLVWQKSLGGSGHDYEQDVHATSDGGCLVSGYSTSNDIDVSGHHGDTTQYDAWIVKLDKSGALQWEQSYGGSGMEGASGIIPTSDGGCVFAGNSSSTDGDLLNNPNAHQGSLRCWIVKLAAMPAGVAQKEVLPTDAFDVYPNPARDHVVIRMREGAVPDHATIDVVDIYGRIVSSVPLSSVNSSMTVPFDATLPTGTYLLRTGGGARFLNSPRFIVVIH